MDAKPGQTVFTGGTGVAGRDGHSGCQEPGLTVATNGNGENESVCALGADIFIDYKKQSYAMSCRTLTWCSIHWAIKSCRLEFSVLAKAAARVVAVWHA